mmetsp:Transcript_24061/g.47232  ORF Transcript_24061/g.47232 Transcript_24061/m.47232 type:complete len:152 (-) Transcript_24061:3284-3739(-)
MQLQPLSAHPLSRNVVMPDRERRGRGQSDHSEATREPGRGMETVNVLEERRGKLNACALINLVAGVKVTQKEKDAKRMYLHILSRRTQRHKRHKHNKRTDRVDAHPFFCASLPPPDHFLLHTRTKQTFQRKRTERKGRTKSEKGKKTRRRK